LHQCEPGVERIDARAKFRMDKFDSSMKFFPDQIDFGFKSRCERINFRFNPALKRINFRVKPTLKRINFRVKPALKRINFRFKSPIPQRDPGFQLPLDEVDFSVKLCQFCLDLGVERVHSGAQPQLRLMDLVHGALFERSELARYDQLALHRGQRAGVHVCLIPWNPAGLELPGVVDGIELTCHPH
jgi:hypothetical protein